MHKNPLTFILLLMAALAAQGCSAELERRSYLSGYDNSERDYYVYLPEGYNKNEPDKKWPVLMFLHGTNERGNGKDELDYVLTHGPLSEAWLQKRNLPFIIIAPQLHMFGLDTLEAERFAGRSPETIPKRSDHDTPPRSAPSKPEFKMEGAVPAADMPEEPIFMEYGWNKVENDLIAMLDTVLATYNADKNRVYLSGISYGGFGTWYLAGKYPERFAAISPVVGWLHPVLAEPIASANIPVWAFAAGRDTVTRLGYFFEGMNLLEELGSTHIRFTVHEDMGHDAWKRVYSGDDIYTWLLQHSLEQDDSPPESSE